MLRYGTAWNGKARSCNGIVLRRKELQRQSIEQQRVAEAKQGLVTQCNGNELNRTAREASK